MTLQPHEWFINLVSVVQELVGSEGFEPWPNQTRSYSLDYRLYYIIVRTVDVLKIFSVEKPDIVMYTQ